MSKRTDSCTERW